VQTRVCVDLNNCGTTYNKPATSQPCQVGYQPPQQEEKKKFEWWKILIPILILLIVIIGIVVGLLVTRKKPGLEIKQEIVQAEVPQELVEYVKNTLQQGASRKEIEEKLKQAGWPQDLIDIAFEKVRQESKQ
jgi:flagellar biosynthesis/type III secretory pathway M-ring protein FliF/YscJ